MYHDYGGKVGVYIEDEIPMTLQVALVGTDGTVLASDTKIAKRLNNRVQTFSYTKLNIDQAKGRLTCWAGENPTGTVAENILKMDSDNIDRMLDEMKTVFGKEVAREMPLPNGEVMLLTTRNPKVILHVECRDGRYSKQPSENKVVSGNHSNPAMSLVELFYDEKCPSLSARELIPLAAHTILTAGRYNPAGIGGLEIVICTTQGFELLKKEEITELTGWSKKLDVEFCSRIFRQS